MPATIAYAYHQGGRVIYVRDSCAPNDVKSNIFHNNWSHHHGVMVPGITGITQHQSVSNGDIEMSWVVVDPDDRYVPITKENFDNHGRLNVLFAALNQLCIDVRALRPEIVQIRKDTPYMSFCDLPRRDGYLLYSDVVRLLTCWNRVREPVSAPQLHLCKARFRLQLHNLPTPGRKQSFATGGNDWMCQEYNDKMRGICGAPFPSAGPLCGHLKARHGVAKEDLLNEVDASMENLDYEGDEYAMDDDDIGSDVSMGSSVENLSGEAMES